MFMVVLAPCRLILDRSVTVRSGRFAIDSGGFSASDLRGWKGCCNRLCVNR